MWKMVDFHQAMWFHFLNREVVQKKVTDAPVNWKSVASPESLLSWTQQFVGRIIPTNGMMPRVILFFVATPMAPPLPGRVFSSRDWVANTTTPRGWDIATTTRPGLCQRSHHVLRLPSGLVKLM